MKEMPTNSSKNQTSQKLVEMVRELLRLYGRRSAKLAEYDLKLREKSLEQAKRIVADTVGRTLQADNYVDDSKFELRLLARAIARVSPADPDEAGGSASRHRSRGRSLTDVRF